MAWNQPGGNGRDPWGDRGGKQGPPDLDEVLKKLQARLSSLFGSRPGIKIPGGGGGGLGLVVLLVVAVLALIGYGIYIVDPAERAVVLRFGQFNRITQPGPHWAWPVIEKVEKVNVKVLRNQDIGFRTQGTSISTVAHEALMLTEDENIIDIQFAVQYRVRDPAAFLFNVLDPEITLRQATESAVREVVGRSGMDFVITEGRDAIAEEVKFATQDILDVYRTGINITSVNMQDAQPPAEVQDAFFDAIKAREDQERIINEANAYKADVVPKARGEAQAVVQRAEAYRARVVAQAEGETSRFLQVLAQYKLAPEITRERLYLEAVESVMSNSTKVLMDVQGGNSLMYLPLDRLMSTQGREVVGSGVPGSSDTGTGARSGFDNTRSSDSLSGRSLQ